MVSNLDNGTFSPREEAQMLDLVSFLLLAVVDIFPYPPPKTHTQLHGEQADKELTEMLLPEGQMYADGFWLLSKPNTQLRMPTVISQG